MAECQRCPFQSVVSALSELIKTFRPTVVDKNNHANVREMNQAQYLAYKSKNAKVKKVANALEKKYADFMQYIDKEILPLCQKVCITCSTVSNDDNLSNHGRTFISIDALNSAPATYDADIDTQDRTNVNYDNPYNNQVEDVDNTQDGESNNANGVSHQIDGDTEDRVAGATGSWLNKNAIKSVHSLNPQGSTNLPSHIEDTLRKILHDFSALDIYEQNLVFQQMCGTSLADFGSMGWIPPDMKKPQSKQLVSIRWEKLVQKFPLAAALRKAKPLQGYNTPRNKHYSEDIFVQEELGF